MKQETLENGLAGPAASVSGGVAAWLDQIDLSTGSTRGQTTRLKTGLHEHSRRPHHHHFMG